MKALRVLLAVMALLGGVSAAVPAWAHGPYYGGVRGYWYGPSVRFYYGAPYGWGGPGYYWPGYYGVPYGYVAPPYLYAPSVAGPAVVYIEREPAAGTAPATPTSPRTSGGVTPAVPPPPPGTQWWYVCPSPPGAYPYVRECPGGWERVPAVPPASAR